MACELIALPRSKKGRPGNPERPRVPIANSDLEFHAVAVTEHQFFDTTDGDRWAAAEANGGHTGMMIS